MTLISGRDWSIGLSSPTSIDQAQLLGLIGRRLRNSYDDVVDQPIPDRLATLVRQLEDRLARTDGAPQNGRAQTVTASD
jgi:Anti-sigma factor NepR